MIIAQLLESLFRFSGPLSIFVHHIEYEAHSCLMGDLADWFPIGTLLIWILCLTLEVLFNLMWMYTLTHLVFFCMWWVSSSSAEVGFVFLFTGFLN